jgi:hypothetical protein
LRRLRPKRKRRREGSTPGASLSSLTSGWLSSGLS